MSIQKTSNDVVWLAIAHVKSAAPDIFPVGSVGAHVAVFGHANNERGFVESARRLLVALQLDIISIDDIEMLSMADFRNRSSNEMYQVAELLNDATPVGYGAFYTYEVEDKK